MEVRNTIPLVGPTKMDWEIPMIIESVNTRDVPLHISSGMNVRSVVQIKLGEVSVMVLASDIRNAVDNAVNR